LLWAKGRSLGDPAGRGRLLKRGLSLIVPSLTRGDVKNAKLYLQLYVNYVHLFGDSNMKAVFVEMPVFEKNRSDYLNDDEYLELQNGLLKAPKKGGVIQGSGGLRKIRWADARRSKGKRSGTRIIYYYYVDGPQFWMFTIYDKDEATDLTKEQKQALKKMLDKEVAERSRL